MRAALILAMTMVLAGGPAVWAADPASTGVDPAPVKLDSTYSLKFPKQYPAGTKLEITQWSHFVPRYDTWFDAYAQDWGKAHNVEVVVNHINIAELGSTLSSAIAAKQGATLYEMIATPAAFIEGLQPLNDVNGAASKAFGKRAQTCERSSYLPIKKEWYGFCHGWVPDPADYRISLWKEAGYPEGPKTYADLLKGGEEVFKKHGLPVGVGMSPEIDSEFYARSLIWSYGGSDVDAKGHVALDSPETVAAVKFQTELFKKAETPEVFSWNAASNNEGFIANHLNYIQNSISFYRSAQDVGTGVAEDTGFSPGLAGPGGKIHMTSHVWYIYVMPKYVTDRNKIAAAKNFLLDLEKNYSNAVYYSKQYNFPAFPSTVPQLWAKGGWLDNDPWGSKPADKLKILRQSEKYTTWLGYPGYANPAVSEVYFTHVISSMMAASARGEKTPEQAVKDAADQIQKIIEKWQSKGYVEK